MSLAKCLRPSARQVLALMVFWGQIQNYMMRVNLSILIVAMVKDPLPQATNDTSVNDEAEIESPDSDTCSIDPALQAVFNASASSLHTVISDEVLFEWDAMTRGIILSSFSYGYVTTQIIGGRMTEIFGVKRVYGFCLLGTAILTLLSPVAAKLHVGAFIAVRVLQGVCEGPTFPALHALAARWIPPTERSSFIARSMFGSSIGLVLTYPLCGALIPLVGWENTFYVNACFTLIWFVFWWFLVYDDPETHPFISSFEKDLIEAAVSVDLNSKASLKVPWKSILTSVPFIGLMITDSCNTWGLWTLNTNGPTYMKYMLGVDIKTNGLLSGLPLLCRYVGGIFHSSCADWLFHRKYLSVIWIRRIFNSISQFGPTFSMLMIAFAPSDLRCDVSYSISLLCIGMFFNGAISSGHFSSFVDLGPNFAGTLFGISNVFSGGATGFIVPSAIGAITNNNMNFSAWKLVFGLAAIIHVIGNTIYLVTISGQVQSWNNPKTKEEEEPIDLEYIHQSKKEENK